MSQPPLSTIFQTPKFEETVIQSGRKDGYWVETFLADPADNYPGIIGYGSNIGEVRVFDNPNNHINEAEWKSYIIAKFNTPIAAVVGDCAGNGLKDIIICHEYGSPTFPEASPSGGHLSWMRNPGRNQDGTLSENWETHFIGRWPSIHRLGVGYFTQRSILEIVALPIIRAKQDLDTPVPIFLFQRNETATKAVEWKRSIIDDKSFTVIHGCTTKRFGAHIGLDSLFIASREGVHWLYYESGEWQKHLIHEGMAKRPGKLYSGSGSVDVGRIGNDPAAYVITIDPFHGGTVSALTKRKTGPKSHEWIRRVLDMYGSPQQRKSEGDGPGHHVITGDFDGDGDDECLVALFGPPPHQGVYYYKVTNVERGLFVKWRVSDKSAARIAVGNFSPSKGLDFATIVFTDRYPKEEPKIHLYTHCFEIEDEHSKSSIISTVWDDKPLYYVPRPAAIKARQMTPLMDVAEYRIHLEIYPPCHKTEEVAKFRDAIRVLWGVINDGDIVLRGLGVRPYGKETSRIQNDIICAGKEGAIFLRFTPINGAAEGTTKGFPDAEKIPVNSLFEFTDPRVQLAKGLAFARYDPNDGRLFYNMTGIYFRFFDDTPLCHVQFWTAAKGVSAGAHDHAEDYFLEVHLSLWTGTETTTNEGTETGGMWYVRPGEEVLDPPESTPDSSYERVPLDSLEHHGAFWDMERDGRPVKRANGSVQYPFHKWQAGKKGENIDIWVAFEFNPDLALDLQ